MPKGGPRLNNISKNSTTRDSLGVEGVSTSMQAEIFLAYDTTTISSYSETLKQVQYGKNKEDDKLPQFNLALVYGQETNLPYYYRKLAGNIPNVSTLKTLLADLDDLGFDKLIVVLERGFYSEANINALYRDHLKFLLSASTSLNFVKRALEEVYDMIWISISTMMRTIACMQQPYRPNGTTRRSGLTKKTPSPVNAAYTSNCFTTSKRLPLTALLWKTTLLPSGMNLQKKGRFRSTTISIKSTSSSENANAWA